jgi:hypothetical protein
MRCTCPLINPIFSLAPIPTILHTLSMPPKRKKLSPRKKKQGNTLSSQHHIIKASLTVLCIFVAYPCLANHPFVSYTSNTCTVELGLDRFMELALIGIGVLTFIFLGFMRRYLKITPFHTYKEWKKIPSHTILVREFTPVVVVIILMGVATVIAYLLFLPSVEHAVRNAPIILDSVK